MQVPRSTSTELPKRYLVALPAATRLRFFSRSVLGRLSREHGSAASPLSCSTENMSPHPRARRRYRQSGAGQSTMLLIARERGLLLAQLVLPSASMAKVLTVDEWQPILYTCLITLYCILHSHAWPICRPTSSSLSDDTSLREADRRLACSATSCGFTQSATRQTANCKVVVTSRLTPSHTLGLSTLIPGQLSPQLNYGSYGNVARPLELPTYSISFELRVV